MTDDTRVSLLRQAGSSPDNSAWKEIFGLYGPFVSGYLRRAGIRESDIDDVRQDVMQILTTELPKFNHNGRKGAFRTWLRLITANRLRSYRRSPAQRHQAVGGSDYMQIAQEIADPRSDLTQIWEQEHNHYVIRNLLDLVSTRFGAQTMKAFRQTFLGEQSVDEVAEELHMTVNAVVLARSRVLKALRQCGEDLID